MVIAGAGVAARLAGVDGIEIVERADFLATVEDESIDGDRRLGLRPRGHGRPALHERHDGRAQGGRPPPPEPGLVPRELARVRERGRGRGHDRQRPAVPHRLGVLRAVHHLHRPTGRAARELRRRSSGCTSSARSPSPTPWSCRPCSTGSSTSSMPTAGGCRRCGRSPTAGAPCPEPSSSAPWVSSTGLDLVNAYGLTETSSTVAVLGPDDHRAAFASDDPVVRERLGSVGRVLPGVELTIRDPEGNAGARRRARRDLGSGRAGLGRVPRRDPRRRRRVVQHQRQRAARSTRATCSCTGASMTSSSAAARTSHPARSRRSWSSTRRWSRPPSSASPTSSGASGWWPRSCSNRARRPTEAELRDHVRLALRSACTPERIKITDELPFNETGKLLRRVLRDELAGEFGPG